MTMASDKEEKTPEGGLTSALKIFAGLALHHSKIIIPLYGGEYESLPAGKNRELRFKGPYPLYNI